VFALIHHNQLIRNLKLIFAKESTESSLEFLYFFISEIERPIYLVSIAGNRFGRRHPVGKYHKSSERVS